MGLGNKIFSIKYHKGNDYFTHKILTILGIKLKFKQLIKNDIELICQNSSVVKNTYQLFILNMLQNASDEDLYCLKNEYFCIIIHKNSFQTDLKFLINFIFVNFLQADLTLTKLNKNTDLYKEHIKRLQNNEFLWKYCDRQYIIMHTFIQKDVETGNIIVNTAPVRENEYVKNSSKFQYLMQPIKREFVKGITLREYFDALNDWEKIKIADKVLNWLFTQYKSETNPKKVMGKYWDCHLYNIIVGDDNLLHFIDFDITCVEDIDRDFCIYKMFFDYNKKIYYEMLKCYKCKDRHKFYMNYYALPTLETELQSKEHKDLIKKYFQKENCAESYKINYEKQEILI